MKKFIPLAKKKLLKMFLSSIKTKAAIKFPKKKKEKKKKKFFFPAKNRLGTEKAKSLW